MVTVAVSLVLAGCGQKGPLYRPEEAPEAGNGNQLSAEPSQIHD